MYPTEAQIAALSANATDGLGFLTLYWAQYQPAFFGFVGVMVGVIVVIAVVKQLGRVAG